MKDYYEVLEIHRDASPVIIKKAYQALAFRYHPDKQTVDRKDWAEQRFIELTEAYRVLSDPLKRRIYDRTNQPRSADHEYRAPSRPRMWFRVIGQPTSAS